MPGSVLVAALIAAATPSSQPAKPVPLRAQWAAPPQCPDRDALRAAIENVVGQPLRFADEAAVHVDGSATRAATGYRVDLVIVVEGDEERRSLLADDCTDAVAAAALVIGLALAPFVHAAPSVPPPAQPPPALAQVPEPAPAPKAEPPRPSPPTARRPMSHRAALFAGGGGAFAMTAPAIGSVFGGAGWLVDRGRIDLSGHHRFATTPGGERGARMSLSGGQLRGCWRPKLAAFEVGPCAGVEVDALVAEGTGPGVAGRRRAVVWASLLAGLDVAWVPASRFAVRASGAVGLVPRRPRLHLTTTDGALYVFTARPVNARLTLAVELRLPG